MMRLSSRYMAKSPIFQWLFEGIKMFPEIMYVLQLEKHKMQKSKTIISTLKNWLFINLVSPF